MGIGRNDRCWCGSGNKHKHCHLQRHAEPATHPSRLAHEIQSCAQRLCLHAAASADSCGPIVAAHTVQRSRVLRAIADETNHLLTFHAAHRRAGKNGPWRVGWHEASTITAFCKLHDATAFAPLESVPFTASPQQCFLHAYRAISLELYSKMTGTRGTDVLKHRLDRGRNLAEQQSIQHRLSVQSAGIVRGMGDLAAAKAVLDEALLAQRYEIVRSVVFDLSVPVNVVATGAFSPDFDLTNQRLQTLHNLDAPIEGLAVSSELTDGGSSVVFSWLSGQAAPQRFIDSLLKWRPRRLVCVLPQIMFLHVENTYFSTAWWASLDPSARNLTGWALRGIRYCGWNPE
jgi:hypothetical protein